MLAREQRGRYHDGDLFAVERGRKRCAKRDLRLAETNVTADQAVHRTPDLEILQRRIDGRELVFSLLIRETRAELVIDMLLHRKFRRFMQMTFGRNLDQFAGDFTNAALEFCFARLPAAAP